MPRTRDGHGAVPPRTLNLRGCFEREKYQLVERIKEFIMNLFFLSDEQVRRGGELDAKLGDYHMYLSVVYRGRANWAVGFIL